MGFADGCGGRFSVFRTNSGILPVKMSRAWSLFQDHPKPREIPLAQPSALVAWNPPPPGTTICHHYATLPELTRFPCPPPSPHLMHTLRLTPNRTLTCPFYNHSSA
ncbi:hypothetical protein LZ30DRAFT_714136 [Colletotrichum cereale]|nr:hypothetical protein LZ30DRAFT_714136 [Colletotrichum cereale]